MSIKLDSSLVTNLSRDVTYAYYCEISVGKFNDLLLLNRIFEKLSGIVVLCPMCPIGEYRRGF
jgi:hypothetical protein